MCFIFAKKIKDMANETKTPNYESLVKARYKDAILISDEDCFYNSYIKIPSINYESDYCFFSDTAWEITYEDLKQNNLL